MNENIKKGTSILWLAIRLYVGWAWLSAGWGKVTGGFDASGFLRGAIAKATAENPTVQGWWASFLEGVALPNAGFFSFLVAYGEVLVGLALIVGFATTFAATMGLTMNFAFMLSGTLSSNPQLAILEIILITLGGAYAGYLGVDYFFRPWFRNKLGLDGKAGDKQGGLKVA